MPRHRQAGRTWRNGRGKPQGEKRPKWPLTGDAYTDHVTMRDAEHAIDNHLCEPAPDQVWYCRICGADLEAR